MKRLFIFWVILLPALTQHVHAQYYSVNYDARTVAAMAAAFGTEAVAESYYREFTTWWQKKSCRKYGWWRS